MHILYIAPYVPSSLRVRPLQLIQQMVSRGHHVTAVVMSANPAEGEMSTELEKLGVTCYVARQPRWKSVAACVLAMQTELPLQVAFCRSRVQMRNVRAVLANGSVDLVHVEHLRAAQYACRPLGLPRIYDAVDCMSLLWERTASGGSPILRRIAKWEAPRTRKYEGALVADFDRVLVSSQVDAEAIRALSGKANTTVLANGVDAAYFGEVPWRPEPDTLIFTGIMRYHANSQAIVRFAREVFPRIKVRRPSARLLVVGSSPTAGVRSLARDPAITVTGYVSDLRPFLARAAVAICPTIVGAGIQNKILEAMAAGVPVVASSLAAGALGLNNGEHLLVADETESQADAISRILDNQLLARQLRASAQEYVRTRYSWKSVADALEQIYLDAIARGPAISTQATQQLAY